jgi:nitrite reductase/ring-hydroxylating ferredoxin subunit
MSDGTWVVATAFDDLPEGKGTRVAVGDATVLLVRSGERVFAIGARCTHQGAPLDRGRLSLSEALATVTCAAHGSVFGLEDGRVLRGPATRPASAYDVRITDGSIEIRARS